jgi:hypothetical protein
MKSFEKVLLMFAFTMIFTTISKAQDFLLDCGSGSPSWCWQQQQQINAMKMQNMMMQQQILQFYRNQAAAVQQQMMNNPFQPIQGVVTYDGNYVTPENVDNYSRCNVKCEHCDGGYNQKRVYFGNNQIRTVNQRCSYCHGKGYVSKLVRNE